MGSGSRVGITLVGPFLEVGVGLRLTPVPSKLSFLYGLLNWEEDSPNPDLKTDLK